MKMTMLSALLALALICGAGCTNMSKTEQGAATGALIGAAGGAGIAALAHGHPGWGALAGAGAGALVGGLIGNSQENDAADNDRRDYDRRPPRDDRRDDYDRRPPRDDRRDDYDRRPPRDDRRDSDRYNNASYDDGQFDDASY